VIVWFITIALLGVMWIAEAPVVLGAINPRHAVTFFEVNGLTGFAVLGAVFLAVTGGEALYADMGHFGRRPIRIAWYGLVLPSLVLNYLGQGALLLANPAAEHPFFELAPAWALYPARRHRHCSRHHRVAGAHLRLVLDHADRRCSWAWPRASTCSTRRRRRWVRSTCRASTGR
jgi:hypothetical protein